MKYYLTLVAICAAIVIGHTQSNPEQQLGSWYMLYGSHRISENLSINTGIEFRYYEVITNYNLDLFGAGLSYRLNPKAVLTANYSYLDIDRSIEFTDVKNTIEHRLYEQFLYQHKLWELPITQRLRLEHRFLHSFQDNTIVNRLRYRLGTTIKLNNTLYIAVSNEIFMNFTEQVFRENRAYAALGIHVHKALKFQLGYMKHHINKLNLNRLQLGILIKTDLRKTPKDNQ